MSEEIEEYQVEKKWGGARIAGPGKEIGRPELGDKRRIPMTFKLPPELAKRLRGERNQTGLIVKLLSEYYGMALEP